MNKQYIYEYGENEFLDLEMEFNAGIFEGYKMVDFYFSDNKDDKVEFLPGIYIRVEDYYEDNHSRNIIKSFLNLVISSRKKTKIIIEINNNRDDIILRFNKNEVYAQRIRSSKMENEFNYNKYNDSKIGEYDYIDCSKIMYPMSSGGSGDRCIMKSIFHSLSLLAYNDYEEYELFTEHEMYTTSATHNLLFEKCKSFERCFDIAEKMHNGTFTQPTEEWWGDNIKLTCNNDVYKISNGNHRVCSAKRFGVKHVYSEVSKKIKYETDFDNSEYMPYFNFYDNRKILESFYKKMKTLNLNDEHKKHILESGLRGVELIEYIEEVNEKDIIELVNTINKPTNN